ncbi:nitric oxide synthase oxygenase [Paenibacillus sacheonensis]|uniref:Nitric oxide synthase oxygenase n=1 Tax=Paenibacillus sacheonensis TaxID=742054 RepID=A0A7X4YQH4_9BACL|nr:nitric oxide synthase oxygenase [Paenibacillus sacheonensis]MBM7566646.1 nitric-oxide synthase [Paenibacillus sacheonensis]NBC70628.1 nitric oxide synthase [Paenibacillus sacheonensis]
MTLHQSTAVGRQELLEEASRFIEQYGAELGLPRQETEARMSRIADELAESGTYTHTSGELAYGAKLAWRNSNRCIGRLFWDSLIVQDARAAKTEDEIADAVFRHIEYATNGGKILPAITIFAPSASADRPRIRIWNEQLVRYAGYAQADGSVIGDPISAELTRFCEELGWRGAGTPFDVLPLVVQLEGREPRWYDLPEGIVLEVPLVHPDLPSFGRLELRWYAVPFVSNMRLEIGGLHYTAAPFNGWYMGTEIGARNLADAARYDMLPKLAALMGGDTSREAALWRDRALVELNVAVLHSFKSKGVTIVDHHTASKQFALFAEKERQSGRTPTGRWSWLIPPLSPATTGIFHTRFDDTERTPNYFYQQALPRMDREGKNKG